ncbi:MAG: error-prone DNA polymerase [Rhizobiaceae bacterium]|nr:error-prone DNA polymerase [Rhizobiaceae bacterium]
MCVNSPYAELGVASNFSFLKGASHPEEIIVRAAKLGLTHIGLADQNTVAGVVRAHMAAKEADIIYHPGSRIVFSDGTSDILAYPKNRKGWGNLCRLLTVGNLRSEKGDCQLTRKDLADWSSDLMICVLPGSEAHNDPAQLTDELTFLKEHFDKRLYLALIPFYDGHDTYRFACLSELSDQNSAPLMATNDAFMHEHGRRPLRDVLSSIEHHQPVYDMGFLLAKNAERHLKPSLEMCHILKAYPEAIAHSIQFAEQLNFSLDELKYQYPDEKFGKGTPQETLTKLAYQGAQERYPDKVPQAILDQIEHELALIKELDYAPYFLTVWDIVRYARSQNILCQGRGSAANSTVCYCLQITDVNPNKVDLLFERFISPERNEPPDIDVDFEHERREEVIQYIYRKYGHDRAGLAATVVTYRARMAACEAGKAFGLSDDAISGLSGLVWGWSSKSLTEREAKEAGLDIRDITTRRVLDYASQLIGFPRHLSQHVGGFVITKDRLDEVVPLMNTAMEGRTMVEWDKDDLEALGILKIDILALGMLSCLAKAFDLLRSKYGIHKTLADLQDEDQTVYDMICAADTIGVFQIESRAQMTMLPRLKPREFYDLVIEVAIVRPGPIQGDMVHPYLRRRQGLEPVTFPKKELEEVLGRTLGVPLFQEQAMKIAIVAADFTPGEADKLRRAMATFRRVGTIHTFKMKMIKGMVKNGYEEEFAERCFKQIEGFGEYGFPESHAASFALLVYASCWFKAYYPDIFGAAILNSQPMGFYAPSQLIRDAREHGVDIRSIDINYSTWNSILEEGSFEPSAMAKPRRSMAKTIRTDYALRLGFKQIKGLRESDMDKISEHRDGPNQGPYDSVRDLWLRTGLSPKIIERLAEADAFRSIGLDRREALWAVKALDPNVLDDEGSLFKKDHALIDKEAELNLPRMRLSEQVINDYRYLKLSLKAHPLSFIRHRLAVRNAVLHEDLPQVKSGRNISVSGLVLVRQRPGSAKGVIFLTLEDETGVANVIVWPKVFERFRKLILGGRLLRVHGKLQNESGVIHIVAHKIEDLTFEMESLETEHDEDGEKDLDFIRRRNVKGATNTALAQRQNLRSKQAGQVMPKGRNFH